MASTWRPKPNDWVLNNDILDKAVTAIQRDCKIDTAHDIPYVAGYSKNGRTLYVDRTLPRSFTQSDGKKVDVMRYLLLHEAVEKALLDSYDIPYQFAHQIALRVERDAVKADGVDWGEYNAFFTKHIKRIHNRGKFDNVPRDLDLTPYHDEEDHATIERMDA